MSHKICNFSTCLRFLPFCFCNIGKLVIMVSIFMSYSCLDGPVNQCLTTNINEETRFPS